MKLCVILLFQIPRYIITIHELLAHTPHDHVERKSLEFAQKKLEELSQVRLNLINSHLKLFQFSIEVNEIFYSGLKCL